MNEARSAMLSEPVELISNTLPWEANLVEGPAIVKHQDYYYMFYSAAGCCGKRCTYKSGVARSKNLMGPWEKDPRNPILVNDENWKCQGHGTPISAMGKNYFLYHGYSTSTGVYTGREGLLREYELNDDLWIDFLPHFLSSKIGVEKKGEVVYFEDDFSSRKLDPSWNWPITQTSKATINKKQMLVNLQSDNLALFGQKIYTKDYSGIVKLNMRKSTASSGIALIGDKNKYISLVANGTKLLIMEKVKGQNKTISEVDLKKIRRKLYLKLEVKNNTEVSFYYSLNNKNYTAINDKAINAGHLPPWDRALRIGLISLGNKGQLSAFDSFILKN